MTSLTANTNGKCLGGVTIRALDLRSRDRAFDSRSGSLANQWLLLGQSCRPVNHFGI